MPSNRWRLGPDILRYNSSETIQERSGTKPWAEPMVQPDGVTDNFRGQTVALVAGRWLFHATQSVKPELNS